MIWTEQRKLVPTGGVAADIAERKRAEKALRQAEQEFRLVVNNIPGIVFKGYLNGAIDFFDHKAEGITGYPKAEFDSRRLKWTDLMLKEDLGEAAKVFIEALKDNKSYVREYRIRSKEEQVIWIQERSHIICKPDGEVDYISGVFFDITKRKQAEEAVRRSEEEFRIVVNNMPTVVFKGYLDGAVDFFDDKVAEMTGYPREEFNSRRLKWTDLILKEDREAIKEPVIQALKSKGSYVREYRVRTKAGKVIWIQERSHAVWDQEGRGEYLSGVFFDITTRKRGEEALKNLHRQNQLILTAAAEGILGINEKGNCTFVNPAAAMMLGYEAEELLGYNFHTTVHYAKADRTPYPEDECPVYGTLKEGLGHSSEEVFWRKDGSGMPVEVQSNPIIEDGKIKGAVLTFSDISERQQAEETLKAERQRLYSLLDGLPAFVYLQGPDHSLRFVNRYFREHFGEPAGRPCYEILHGRQEPCEVCPASRVFETKAPQEWEWTAPSGRTYQLYDYPFVDIDGSLLVLEMGLDITERQQAKEALKDSLHKLKRTLDGTVRALATAGEMRDPYTAGHQMRVTQLACAIAKEMEFSEDRLEGLLVMGFLHDIGKIAVPAEILSKPGEISEFEYSLIKNHSRVGYDILREIEFPWPVAQVILQHHEKLDGSGYPSGLLGQDIILEARILAVADVVEAMASHRPYRAALGIDQALEEIAQKRGILYDSEAVDACLRLFNEKGFKF